MRNWSDIISESDQLLGLVSALAESQNVSESEITLDDLREFSINCGWDDQLPFESDRGTYQN
jgi:hypothetical protein